MTLRFFFSKLREYRNEILNLISCGQYNDRRKFTASLCGTIRERKARELDGGEDLFRIDSKPVEICRLARSKRFQWVGMILKKRLHWDIVLHKGCAITNINFTLSAV